MENEHNNRAISFEFVLRLVGGVTAAFFLALVGSQVADFLAQPPQLYIGVFGLIGFLFGIILTPYVTTRPIRNIRNNLINMPPERLTAVILGSLLGLVAGSLLSVPLSYLPPPFQYIMPIAAVVALSYLSVIVLMLRQNDLKTLYWSIFPQPQPQPKPQDREIAGLELAREDSVLLDTSVIIDGRITDISKTGFLRATVLIPSFILRELQHIADSADPLRRNRGRRGLDVLRILQEESPIPVKITDMDATEARDADSKLVVIAKKLHAPIMTNDYNLNRVAELQGVTVLNINDLANAVKAAYLPGEDLTVKVIQEGREIGQGVGYLEDGTMVVIEDGVRHIGKVVEVIVTKVLQTTAGRMVFARFPTRNELDVREGRFNSDNY